MKKILVLITLFASVSIYAQEINWVTMEEALELQKKEPRKIIMDVYTNWCGPCKMLDRNTFSNKDVANYINKNYYAVKFNAEGNDELTYKDKTYKNPNFDPEKTKRRNSSHEFARFMQVRGYPGLVFFDEKGEYITPIIGYKTPQQLELYLKLFKDTKYKEMKTQDDFDKYYKAFKATFKNNA